MKGWMSVTAVTACTLGGTAAASTHFGWADEFVSAHAKMRLSTDYDEYANTYFHWDVEHYWEGHGEEWAYVGAQADGAASANAVEEVMFDFEDTHYTCYSVTARIERWRTTSPPSIGSSCLDSIQSYVGSRDHTVSSCAFNPDDSLHWHRLLPTYDFSEETATGTIGYRSRVTMFDNQSNARSETGCFKIEWIP